MKKIFNKIGQVLLLLLAAPVKLPGKVGNVLKYVAIGLGILETVLDAEEPPPKVDDDKYSSATADDNKSTRDGAENTTERSIANETE